MPSDRILPFAGCAINSTRLSSVGSDIDLLSIDVLPISSVVG